MDPFDGVNIYVVDGDGSTLSLKVDLNSNVAVLKEAIGQLSAKHKNRNLILKFEDEELQNEFNLTHYDIVEYSAIYLESGQDITIHVVESSGRNTAISTSLNVTIEDFRRQISLRNHIPPNRQILLLDEKPLPNNNTTLYKLGLNDHSLVFCRERMQPTLWERIKSIPQDLFPVARMTKFSIICSFSVHSFHILPILVRVDKSLEIFFYIIGGICSVLKIIEHLDLKVY